MNYRLHQIIAPGKEHDYTRQFKKNIIRFLQGSARFENPHLLIVVDDDYRLRYQVTAKMVVIATDRKPRNPIQVQF